MTKGFLTRLWRLVHCPHEHTRCVHGDEINALAGRRVACLDCGSALDWNLPEFCYFTKYRHGG